MLLMSNEHLSAATRDASPVRGHGATYLPQISAAGSSHIVHHAAHGGGSPQPARLKKPIQKFSASLPSLGAGAGGDEHREKAGGPDVLDELHFCCVSGPSKATVVGEPLNQGAEAAALAELARAAKPGPLEDELHESQRELIKNMRGNIMLYKPDKKAVLLQLRELIETLQMEANEKDDVFEELRARTEKAGEEAAVAMRHLVADREAVEKTVENQKRELLEAESDAGELRHQVEALEEQLKKSSSIGMTAQEAAITVIQLEKARASIESLKGQMNAMHDKVLQAEQEQRQQEAALRERRAQLEKSLKENMEHFGPERFARLQEELSRTSEELIVAKEQVRTSRIAQKQQHTLVVEWRIKVQESADVLAVRDTEMLAQDKVVVEQAFRVDQLEAVVHKAETDAVKAANQLNQVNVKVGEYVEKCARQAAYINEKEAEWRAAEAQRLLQEADDSDADDGAHAALLPE
mmetsp:Transcript_66970/g.159781  ORF Transcript_66970/g.159781 Transcript_66970/m.159781 type:complete len:466 (+) Transcript_66970:125-1522(+)